mmetsp:Transcript_112384/g.195192  ORF Transcript_112384/g.195192 Transcript_112384/m.195192 type:complete len:527 (+) Transcript_112384:257-1837(+)
MPQKRSLDPMLLGKGLGDMGNVPIPMSVWNETIPPSFLEVSKQPLPTKPLSADASKMLGTLTDMYPEMFFVDTWGTLVGMANAWAFVIPKNVSKCSFIFHLVALNGKSVGRPPPFVLPTIEGLAKMMQERLHSMGDLGSLAELWATHVDLGNAFWALVLPEAFWNSFRLQMGDKNVSLLRVPFGWKFSPVLCQRVLQHFLVNLKKGETLILHYLDDFCIIGGNKDEVRRVTNDWVCLLREHGFVVSPKSILEPAKRIKWLGKKLCLEGEGCILNLDGALESALAKWLRFSVTPCTRKKVRSMVGKLSWLARPTVYIAPFIAGAYAHTLWGPYYSSHAPISLLRNFASLLALAHVGWRPTRDVPRPLPFVWSQVLFVDAAPQPGGGFAMGLFGPGFGSRFWRCSEDIKFQQGVELFALIRGVKKAVALGWRVLHLVGDNTSSILQVLGLKASVGLAAQQRLLRELVYVWNRSGIQVFVYYVKSALMPADPISRMFEHWGGNRAKALEDASRVFGEVRAQPCLFLYWV